MDEKEGRWNDLGTIVNDLVAATQDLTRCVGAESSAGSAPFFETSSEARSARRRVNALLGKLQNLVTEPYNFIQRLAHHTQLLACLQWLGEFQILACIPLGGSVAAREVADLADVPETLLLRIVRMMATAGFLSEPQPGFIAHTALSSAFVTDLAHLDATMLLAKTAAPAALHMTTATQTCMDGAPYRPATSAYSLAFNTAQTFQSACEQQPRLNRQWLAYLRCTEGEGDGVAELLTGTGWFNLGLGSSHAVDVGAQSTSTAKTLARLNPALHFTVQLARAESSTTNANGHFLDDNDTTTCTLADNRVAVQIRPPTSPSSQPIKDAALYILNIPTFSSSSSTGDDPEPLRRRILSDLRAHAEILRSNSTAALILLPDLPLYDDTITGKATAGADASCYFRDLSMWQMTGSGWGMGLGELVDLVGGVQDGMGRLAVTDELRVGSNGSGSGAAVRAIYVKYQAKWGF